MLCCRRVFYWYRSVDGAVAWLHPRCQSGRCQPGQCQPRRCQPRGRDAVEAAAVHHQGPRREHAHHVHRARHHQHRARPAASASTTTSVAVTLLPGLPAQDEPAAHLLARRREHGHRHRHHRRHHDRHNHHHPARPQVQEPVGRRVQGGREQDVPRVRPGTVGRPPRHPESAHSAGHQRQRQERKEERDQRYQRVVRVKWCRGT